MNRKQWISENQKAILPLALAIVLFTSGLFVYSAGHRLDVSASPSWLDGWQYRKAHTIYSAVDAGTNYAVKTEVKHNDSSNPVQQPSNVLNDDGCWCWFQDPKAVYYMGKTYFTWTRSNGDVGISCYDNDTKRVEHFTLSYSFDKDDHSCPSMLIRSDGRIITFYTQHSTNIMRWKISNNPRDISSWSSEHSFIGAKNSLCYSQPVQLSGENDTIYLFYRSLGSPGYWVYRKSHDGGETFGNEIDLLTFTRWSPYTKVASNFRDKIHLAFGDDYGSANPHRDIMYCYYYNGSFYRANGSLIKSESQLPINDKTSVDMIYNSSAAGNYDAWIWDIALSDSEVPHVVFSELRSNTDHRYRYAKWTGSQWTNVEICSAGGYIDGPVEGYYSGGLCLDHNDPRTVYLSKQIDSGQFEIYQYSTSDGGASWTQNAITSNSTARNCRPTFVINSTGAFKIIWWFGTYNFYTDFKTSLLGFSVDVVGSVQKNDNVSCEGHCRTDFGDVRFTSADGTTLDYWMEEKTDGDYAVFWIKIPDDLSTEDATIYMYYGKSDATTTSNGDTTFLLFDDFLTTSLNETLWSVEQGDFSLSSSNLQLTGTSGTRGLMESTRPFSANTSVHSRVRISNTSSTVHHFCSMRQNGSWDNRAGDVWTTGTNRVGFETAQAGVSTITYVALNDVTSYHSYETAWDPRGSRFYQDHNLAATITNNIPLASMTVVFYEGMSLGTVCYVDWCFVRKCVDPEPARGTWGNQEQVYKPALTISPTAFTCRKLNETFTLELKALDLGNVLSFSFAASFNTTLLDYASAVWLSFETGSLTVNEDLGTIVGHADTAIPISGDYSLLNITFLAAYSHIWRNENGIPGWKNNQSGTISFHTATLGMSDGSEIEYEKGVIDEIDILSETSVNWIPIKGDLNNDGRVDIFDVCSLVMYFSTKEGDPLWPAASKYDLTNDGIKIINAWDLMIVGCNYGFEYD